MSKEKEPSGYSKVTKATLRTEADAFIEQMINPFNDCHEVYNKVKPLLMRIRRERQEGAKFAKITSQEMENIKEYSRQLRQSGQPATIMGLTIKVIDGRTTTE